MTNEEENFAPPEITHKRVLQKISKVIAIICLITAVGCGVYMTFFIGDSKVIKASLGATTFFCFMVALVLNTIADTNLPNMKITCSNPAKAETTHSNSDKDSEQKT